MSSWSGSPSTTSLQGFSPWMKPPGYDFSSKMYDYMSGMIGQPAPMYGGFDRMAGAAGANSGGKYLKKMSGLADRYMDTGMPTIFGQATGALSRFLNPSFMNPAARSSMGFPSMVSNPFGGGFGQGGLMGGSAPRAFSPDRGMDMTGGGFMPPGIGGNPMMRLRNPMPGGFQMDPKMLPMPPMPSQ